ncbi:MAG: hypothetical protein KC931_15855 [Candidatus Omnitrophica bacterium]|nr:hypothetical protein [Candidatus Omnitrophota bacterium]MCA9424636.1 hypothetical protein [Candidatus Omnitrophota bacterium]MCA9432449.1 hypothetical protein [Candidatus Omnitrophota bacterium]MCA9448598.1 hypothetical protein [Candidatus Omnitrophota bacterium]
MKSITLHKLDSALAEKLEQVAHERGQSLNRAAQDLLRVALGIDRSPVIDRAEVFRDQFGTWSQEDLDEFNRRNADMSQVDPKDWED